MLRQGRSRAPERARRAGELLPGFLGLSAYRAERATGGGSSRARGRGAPRTGRKTSRGGARTPCAHVLRAGSAPRCAAARRRRRPRRALSPPRLSCSRGARATSAPQEPEARPRRRRRRAGARRAGAPGGRGAHVPTNGPRRAGHALLREASTAHPATGSSAPAVPRRAAPDNPPATSAGRAPRP